MPVTSGAPASAPEGAATVRQAAKFLAVCEKTIRNLIDRRELPSVKVGKSRRIAWATLRAYLEPKTEAGPATGAAPQP